MSRMPTLLLIRGLGHSGTTILDLALGATPGDGSWRSSQNSGDAKAG